MGWWQCTAIVAAILMQKGDLTWDEAKNAFIVEPLRNAERDIYGPLALVSEEIRITAIPISLYFRVI